MTQQELAEELGLEKSAIAKYETGRVSIIERATWIKMADVLQCSIPYLMGADEAEGIEGYTSNAVDISVDNTESFRERFERAIENSGLKPIDIAKKTGISQATISQYRSGYSKPKSSRLFLLAHTLNVSPSWLMGVDTPYVTRDSLHLEFAQNVVQTVFIPAWLSFAAEEKGLNLSKVLQEALVEKLTIGRKEES
jgi:transcriptional regulator, cro/CI family